MVSRFPPNPSDAEQALALPLADEQEMKKLVEEFNASRSDVDRVIDALYQTRAMPNRVIEVVGE